MLVRKIIYAFEEKTENEQDAKRRKKNIHFIIILKYSIHAVIYFNYRILPGAFQLPFRK